MQGGERYLIKTNKKEVVVDWIIRKDEFKKLFAQALSEAVEINGVPILTPEWLVILKFIAGRFKDQEDAVFLLSRQDLVDRNLIKEKLSIFLAKRLGGWRDTAIKDGSTLPTAERAKNGAMKRKVTLILKLADRRAT